MVLKSLIGFLIGVGGESSYFSAIISWWKSRDSLPKKSIIVVSRNLFSELVRKLPLGLEEGVVIISIESTRGCREYYGREGEDHLLPPSDLCLNLDFDDLERKRKLGDYVLSPLSWNQAKLILEFAEKNRNKHFLIHCRAGKSRSQAVGLFLSEIFSETHELSLDRFNPPHTPNSEVLRKLRGIARRKGIL